MKTGRNDPCPCGSGRKYKLCCLRLERRTQQRPGLGAAIRRAAKTATSWQADIVPIPAVLADDPAARPAALIIMGGGLVLHLEMLSRPSAEPQAIAEELERQLAVAGERLAVLPTHVMVRHPEVAVALADRLAPRIKVEVGPLDELHEAARGLRAEMSGGEPRASFACSPITWAGWGLGEAWCERLFQGAAAFFRAAPWQHLWDSQVLELTGPSGDRWLACVMGRGGQEFGLALYEKHEDVESIFSGGPDETAAELTGRVITLLFSPGSELPKEMRKELSRARWEVATAEAYPKLMTINTPAGGVTLQNVGDLLAFLCAVPWFVESQRQKLETGVTLPEACHRESGVGIRGWNRGMDLVVPTPGPLRPGAAQGARARPQAALDRTIAFEDPDLFLARELEVVKRFRRALEREGLRPRTVDKHADNAETFVRFLAFHMGLTLAAAHELDLRMFLFDWFPRKVICSRSRAMGVPGSLRRFFGYLADEEEIRLPTADEVLDERDFYVSRWESFPGGHWWDTGVGEWSAFAWRALHARVMVHDEGLGSGEWGGTMGRVEAELEHELQRRWLLWRDELLEQGVTDNYELRRLLVERQRAWETAPHADLGGRTPVQAVGSERQEAG